jgi:hypothetical protein
MSNRYGDQVLFGTDIVIYEKGLKILYPQRSVEDRPRLLESSTLLPWPTNTAAEKGKVESEAQEEEVSRQMTEAAHPTVAGTVSPKQPSPKLSLDVRRKRRQ